MHGRSWKDSMDVVAQLVRGISLRNICLFTPEGSEGVDTKHETERTGLLRQLMA